jgi:hypothetical protein
MPVAIAAIAAVALAGLEPCLIQGDDLEATFELK